jgi:TM2 domain-containing membrane protein YozV
MRGKVLSYSDLDGLGLISGDDGARYDFVRGGLQNGLRFVQPGKDVDFQIDGTRAINIYVVGPPTVGQVGDKNKLAAALLALFLGHWGVHKFYLNKQGAGIIMLLCGTIGILLIIPFIAVRIISLVEFVVYLTKTDRDFHRDYVAGNKEWF